VLWAEGGGGGKKVTLVGDVGRYWSENRNRNTRPRQMDLRNQGKRNENIQGGFRERRRFAQKGLGIVKGHSWHAKEDTGSIKGHL